MLDAIQKLVPSEEEKQMEKKLNEALLNTSQQGLRVQLNEELGQLEQRIPTVGNSVVKQKMEERREAILEMLHGSGWTLGPHPASTPDPCPSPESQLVPRSPGHQPAPRSPGHQPVPRSPGHQPASRSPSHLPLLTLIMCAF